MFGALIIPVMVQISLPTREKAPASHTETKEKKKKRGTLCLVLQRREVNEVLLSALLEEED